jgi:glucose/arabinose dehydrogenase
MSRRRSIAVLFAAALVASCGGSGSASRTAAPPAAQPAVRVIATGLQVPWGIAFLPGGDALVSERTTGRIVRVPAAGGALQPVMQVPGVDTNAGEGGLLGLAVSPTYARDRLVYAYFTSAQDNRVVRFRLGAPPQPILTDLGRNAIHDGGRIAFGPDGMLYVGTGDAAQPSRSQDPDSPNGKILRLTPDGDPAPGNPRAGSPIWTSGHRNVQGLAWSADGTMYAPEFGQNRFDEVNVIEKGKNYGWPEVEGTASDSRYQSPLVSWTTAEASPSGAAIAGDTLYVAALRGERLWTIPLGGGDPKAEFTGRYGRLRTVAVAPDGALWLTTSNTDRGPGGDGDDRILRFKARS